MAAKFVDDGEHSLKNIAGPVRVYRVELGGEGTAQPAAAAPVLPDKPSIAVLPFANMSGDPEQEFFADGIAEDIITALSRYSSLFVIARNSSFSFKGRAVDVKQVGRELGVRYVLEGSLRKSGNRIRVTAQLVRLRPAIMSGPSATTVISQTFLPCRMKSLRLRPSPSPPPSPTPSNNGRCASRRQALMHGVPINAACGISARQAPRTTPSPRSFFNGPPNSIRCLWADILGLPPFSAGRKGHKIRKKRRQGAQSRSMAATQRRIPAWLLRSSHAATTRAHVLKPSRRW